MSLTLDERAVRAKQNEEEFERLFGEYRPFILGCVYNNGFGRDQDDIGLAISAFYEAVKTYQITKGSFLSFAGTVIRCRLIDKQRKILQNSKYTVSGEEADMQIEDHIHRQQREVIEHQQDRRLEIQDFLKELHNWGIDVDDLSSASPRHRNTRNLCSQAVNIMLDDTELRVYINDKKRLPIKELAQKLNVTVKMLEKHRRYLIAAFLIHSGDYPYLKEYVPRKFFRKEAAL